ncbi:MAG: electron transfer flavoprotein-ubiquinone oxidoreductase [Firmicutes bacterium]|nr:electron transfer flavoprotein-ubiquinone oxidoreductase [Bacillota bacterium]
MSTGYQKIKPHKLVIPSTITPKTTKKKYDAIVVGAGPAGSTAAYFMAKEGMNVLLLERGPYPGAKNCGGASIIAEATHKLFPNFWDEMDCERLVTSQSYWWLDETSAITAGFRSMRLAAAPFNRFTVKRPIFYAWLAQKAVTEGATLCLNHHVSHILWEGRQAYGVALSPPQDDNELLADIIIAADGANSLLTERSGLTPAVSPNHLSLYVKETIALSSDSIEERFNLKPGHGALIGLIGYPTAGFNGTASIHTFKDSISINIGMTITNYVQAGLPPFSLLARLKRHPVIDTLIRGGITTEYGSATIPEGGYTAIPKLIHPGVLVVGDAASLVNGTHGFNLAMWSGYFAAQTAINAKISGDFSIKSLHLYRQLLDKSFILQNMKHNAKAASFERDVPYFFSLYSHIANEAAFEITKVYTMPIKTKRKLVWKKIIGLQPITRILRDMWKGIKVLWGN